MANTRIYWLHALSPTHAGIGRGVGYIDLPIDRDRVTGWPLIRGSAFKGVWADYHNATDDNRKNDPLLRAAFGRSSSAENESNSGALIPTDAQLVCLPIRSFQGTFAWATSPLCLRMLQRTLDLAGEKNLPDVPVVAPGEAHHSGSDPSQTALRDGNRIYLEDLDFTARPCPAATDWSARIARFVFSNDKAWQTEFEKRFVIIPGDAFDFLCETGTEVHTRVKIDDDNKVVEKGKLWTEESLPAESILAGMVQCERVFQKNGATDDSIKADALLSRFASHDPAKPLILQIGGKATVGRGQMRCVFAAVNGGAG